MSENTNQVLPVLHKTESMNEFGLAFHHLGLAVVTPEQAFIFLKALGYTDGPILFDPLQQVNLAMRYHTEMPDVEVIWPGDGPSPIDAILKRRDSMLYHICYTSNNVEDSLAKMRAKWISVTTVTDARVAVLFDGLAVSFYYAMGFGLIEIIHCNA